MGRREDKDALNVPLEDRVLLEELELLSRLMVAANQSDGPLCRATLDALLNQPPPATRHR